MTKVWIRTHISTGNVSVHSNPPRPQASGMKEERFFNHDGEEVTTYFDSYGSPRTSWVETVVHE